MACAAVLALAGRAQSLSATVEGITYTVEDGAQTATVAKAYVGLTTANILGTVEIEGTGYPVAAIGNGAFMDCMSLESVTLPQGLRDIGESAFQSCASLASITVPEGVTAIGYYAFSACTSLASVTLPEGLASLGDGAFTACRALPGITLPSTLASIGYAAFMECSALESIVLPSSLEVVSNYAFQRCGSLADVTIPEGVAAIGEFAFADCQSLDAITLPSTLESIGESAFYEVPLADITCRATVPPVLADQSFDREHYMDAALHVPAGSEPAYRAAKGWMNFFDKVTVDGILYVVNPDKHTASVMDGTSATGSFSIPATVEYEGEDYAVTSIGEYAFYACMGLTSIAIPEGVTFMGFGAFGACRFLESVTLPSTLVEIGVYGFGGCVSLRDIHWHAGLQRIGDSAFEECTSLASVTLPSTLQYLGEGAFAYCESIERIVVPQGLAAFGAYAFEGCMSLSSVTLPEGLQAIPEGAFCETALESIDLPESVTSIEFYAFAECASLESIALPAALQEIGNMAFAETPLADVYSYAAVPPAIEADTFDEATYAEAALHVPTDVTGLYGSAEYWELFQRIDGDLPSTGIGHVSANASLATYANGVVATSGLADITVHDASGAQVRHAEGVASLSLEGLPRGIYIISIEQGGQRQVLKVAR